VRRADLATFMCRLSRNSGSLNLLKPSGPVQRLLYHLPKRGMYSRSADFHETHNNSIYFCAQPLYRNLYKSDQKCIKYRQNFIYILKESMASRAPIKTKHTSAQRQDMTIFYTEFHPNRSINMEGRVEIHLCL
jgi:hypothetical protein